MEIRMGSDCISHSNGPEKSVTYALKNKEEAMFNKLYSLIINIINVCYLFVIQSFFYLSTLISSPSLEVMPIGAHILKEDPAFEYALKEIYDDAFNGIYGKNNWENMFEYYIGQFKESNDMMLYIALQNDHMAAWALFKHDNESAILELLCVDPDFWRHGIGKKLVFAIRDYVPTINHIALVTRTVNRISPHFYESLGFKKTAFTLPEYSSMADQIQGYEWFLM